MKKKGLLLATATLAAALTAQADGYGYFALRQTGGDVTTLAASGLRITFADGNLIATQGGQTTTLALSGLDAMYFTAADAAGISGLSTSQASLTVSGGTVKVAARQGAQVSLYALGGTRVASLTATGSGEQPLAEGLQKGVYILNVDGKATKFIVK